MTFIHMYFSVSHLHYEVSINDFIINLTTNNHLATSSSFQLHKLLSLGYRIMITEFDNSNKRLQIFIEL